MNLNEINPNEYSGESTAVVVTNAVAVVVLSGFDLLQALRDHDEEARLG